jgi:hypothetical protein
MGEFVGLATGRPLLAVVLVLVTALSGVVRGWITHRTTNRHEIEATRRVLLAVDDTNSTERAAVVRACAELEAASHLMARSRRPRVNRQCPYQSGTDEWAGHRILPSSPEGYNTPTR